MGQKLELNKHLFYYFRMEGVYVEHFTLVIGKRVADSVV